MSYDIKQAVGDYNASSAPSISLTPSPGSTVWIAAHQIVSNPNITATPDAVNPLGSAVEVGDYYITQAVIESTSGVPLTITSGVAGILVAVEISGLTGNVLSTATAKGTVSGSGSPYTLNGPASGALSAVPALALAFGVNAQENGDFSGVGSGYTAQAISWATAPPTGMCLLEFIEVTAEGTVASEFSVSSQYDSYGIALAVIAEGANPYLAFAEWDSQPLFPGMNREVGFTAPAVIGVCGDYPNPWGSIVDIFPQSQPTSGTLVVNDCGDLTDASAENEIFSLDYSQITAGVAIPVNATFRTGLSISQVPAGMKFGISWDGPLYNGGGLAGWARGGGGRINP